MSNFFGNLWHAGTLKNSEHIDFNIDDAVARRIAALPDAALEALALAMKGKAEANAPVLTGMLKAGIRAWRVKPRGSNPNQKRYWKIGSYTRRKLGPGKLVEAMHKGKKVYRSSESGRRVNPMSQRRGYGAPVEFGHFMRKANGMPTRFIPAKPFLRPARVWTAANVDSILTAAGVPLK